MNVSEVMTRHTACCEPFDTMEHAARIMWDHDCGAVPVVDGSGLLHGIVTDRDLAMSAYLKGRTLASITVAESMARELHCCAASDTLERALASMKQHQVHRMPVVDGEGRLQGMLALADVLQAAQRTEARQRQPLADAILETLTVVRTPRVAPPLPAAGAPSAVTAVMAQVDVPAAPAKPQAAPTAAAVAQKPAAKPAQNPAPKAAEQPARPSTHVASAPTRPKKKGRK